jgi:nucleoside-diphosphate-sugar epimerase
MVLVTGASGFLGGALAAALVARGDRVRVLLRATSDAWRLDGLDVERVEGNVQEARSLRTAMDGVETVFHAAGMLGQPGVPEAAYTALHVEGTLNVVRAADAAGVARVVYVSSPGLLGPIDDAPADEDARPSPTNPYERSKAAAEEALAALPAPLRARVVTVRPEFVYGPGDTHVLRLFRSIARGVFFYIGSGRALCHPTYVDDAVRGILAAADRGAGGRVYHVAGPRPVTVRELGSTFAAALGVRAPFVRVPEAPLRLLVRALEIAAPIARRKPPLTTTGIDFFTMNRQFSTARARRELGWEPQIDLREGAARTVRWYREKGHLKP